MIADHWIANVRVGDTVQIIDAGTLSHHQRI